MIILHTSAFASERVTSPWTNAADLEVCFFHCSATRNCCCDFWSLSLPCDTVAQWLALWICTLCLCGVSDLLPHFTNMHVSGNGCLSPCGPVILRALVLGVTLPLLSDRWATLQLTPVALSLGTNAYGKWTDEGGPRWCNKLKLSPLTTFMSH